MFNFDVITNENNAETVLGTAKTASKTVVQKIAGGTEDLIINKTADKITSVGKATKILKNFSKMNNKIFTCHLKNTAKYT